MEIKKIAGMGAGTIFQVFVNGTSFILTVPKGTKMEQVQEAAQIKYAQITGTQEQEEYDV